MADITEPKDITRANWMHQYYQEHEKYPSLEEIKTHMASIDPEEYDTQLSYTPEEQVNYHHIYKIKQGDYDDHALQADNEDNFGNPIVNKEEEEKKKGFAGNFAVEPGSKPTSQEFKSKELDEDDILKSEEPEYMGVTKRQWELLGGMGANAAGKGIAAIVGGGKKAGNSLIDWVEENKRQKEVKNREEYDLAQDRKKAEEELRGSEKAGSQRFKDWKVDRQSKIDIKADQLAQKEKAETEALETKWGFDPRNLSYKKLIAQGLSSEEAIELAKQRKDVMREGLDYAPRGTEQNYDLKSHYKSYPTREYEKSLHAPPSMEQVPEQTSALAVAAEQPLHDKIREKYGRFITHNREKVEALEAARTARTDARTEEKRKNDAMRRQKDLLRQDEIDLEKSQNAKMTKKYWQDQEGEFKSLYGQYRILDPTNKYEDVEANPQGKWDQKMKAWLMRKATRAKRGTKWYHKQDYKYDWK